MMKINYASENEERFEDILRGNFIKFYLGFYLKSSKYFNSINLGRTFLLTHVKNATRVKIIKTKNQNSSQ
jgi:hypothetical protein